MKDKILHVWISLRAAVGIPMLILIALLSCFFLYAMIRDWRTNRQIEAQSERIGSLARDAQLAVERADEHLSRADITHAQTLSMLEVVQQMSDNIKTLAEADRRFTVEVKNLKNDYENARTQTRSQKLNDPVRPRDNRSLRRREDDVLAADRELYGQ